MSGIPVYSKPKSFLSSADLVLLNVYFFVLTCRDCKKNKKQKKIHSYIPEESVCLRSGTAVRAEPSHIRQMFGPGSGSTFNCPFKWLFGERHRSLTAVCGADVFTSGGGRGGGWMRRLSGDRLFSLPAQFPSRGRVDLWWCIHARLKTIHLVSPALPVTQCMNASPHAPVARYRFYIKVR